MSNNNFPEKMNAVVAYGPKDFRYEEVPTPKIENENEIIAKVTACGICASDVSAYYGAARYWGDETQDAWMKAPVILGHEFVGEVVDKGGKVTDFEIGDHITSEQIVPCGECRFCQKGQYWMCQKHDIYGFQNNVNGGMAEYIKFPAKARNHKIPNDIPVEKAVLVEPFACSLHAVDRADVQFGDVVVLSGAGTLGLGMVGALSHTPLDKLIVLDMKDDRLDLAKKYGADITMNPGKEDVVSKIKELTDGYGTDVYIEASGSPKSVEQGLNAIRNLGTFVEFSVFKEKTTVDWSIISDQKELDVKGSHLGPYSYPWTIEHIGDGSYPTEGMVTHQLELKDFEKGLDMVKNGEDSIKVILKP